MSLYKKVEKFVEESFGKDKIRHFKRTVFWIKKLQPGADETMLMAAISHDIERAFRKNGIEHARSSKKGFMDKKYLKFHQKEGAKIMARFLKSKGASSNIIRGVKTLIEKHEIGGNKNQNILKDADSISFFENNTGHFIEEKVHELGNKKVKEKFDWMFNRITSQKAKAISQKWYDQALKKLGY